MGWLILLVVSLVLLLVWLLLPWREWRGLLRGPRELLDRARRPAARSRPAAPAPEEDDSPEQEEGPSIRRMELSEEAAPGQVPAAGEEDWQGRRGRPALDRMLGVTEEAEEPTAVPRPAPRRRPSLGDFRHRGWLILLFVVVLLVAALLTAIPRAADLVQPTHRFTIAVADLRAMDLPGSEPRAAASDALRDDLRQAMNRAAMTDTVQIDRLRQVPVDAPAAYALARSGNVDMLLWGEVQEGEVPRYALTLTLVPHAYSEAPELEEYLQVMVTPPQFAMNRPGAGALAQDDVATALVWLVHFYRGEFERIEAQGPEQFQDRPLAGDLFDFHWAARLWFRGEYGAAQERFGALAGQGYSVALGPQAPPTVCAATVPRALCAAALNNQAAAILTREARGQVPPDTLIQAVSLLLQARQAAGFVTDWRAFTLEEARDLFARAVQADPGSLVVQYNLGRAYLARRNWAQAAAELQLFDNPHTRDARAMAALSEAYIGAGDAANAERTSRRAVDLDANIAEGHLARGRYWLGMGNLEEAGKELDQALTLAQNEGKRRRSHEVAVRTGPQPNPQRAEYLGAWAERSDPLIARAHLVRGNRYLLVAQSTANPDVLQYLWNLLTGAPDAAAQAWQEIGSAMEIRPGWYDALCLHGSLAFVRHDYDGAIGYYQQAQQVDRNDVESYQALAETYLARNQPDQAQAQYRALVDSGITPAAGHFGLGEMARRAGDWAAARDEYLAAVQSDPTYALAYLQLGVVEVELGQEDEGMQHFDQAIAHAGLQRWIYLAACAKRGEVLLEQYLRSRWEGRRQEALLESAFREFDRGQQVGRGLEFSLQVQGVVVREALPLRQYYALRLLNGFGRVAFEKKDYAGAENRFRQVLQQDRGNADALYGEGRVLLAREASGAAVSYLEDGVRANPNGIAVRYHLGMAYYAQMRFALARVSFERVNQLCAEQQDPGRLRVDDREACQQAPLQLQQLSAGAPAPTPTPAQTP